MKISLESGEGIKKQILYPDNQPHVQIEEIPEGTAIILYASLTSSKRVLEMLQIADAVQQSGAHIQELHIPYLMAARFDRQMEEGDSFDLRVVAKLINMCEAKKVFLYDPHSDVAPALITNCRIISNKKLVEHYDTREAVLIIPDAGAAKKSPRYKEWNSDIVDEVQCAKHRDLSNGTLSLKVLEPEKCKGRNCVIIDDLCDGGGTFIQIANQIEPASLTLIVTHGVFSRGFETLDKLFDKIITSNSYRESYDSSKTEVIKLF